MKVFIQDNPRYKGIISYTLDLIFQNKGVQHSIVGEKTEADIIINEFTDSDFNLALDFYSKLEQKKYSHTNHLQHDHFIRNESGKVDHLATIFYLVNCVQEYNFPEDNLDHYQRFPYSASLQNKFNIVEKNVVQNIIDLLFSTHPKLKGLKNSNEKSEVIFSHDIDHIFTPIKRDIKWSLLKAKFILTLRLLWCWIKSKSRYLNYKYIIKLHTKLGFNSIYFYLVKDGTDENGIPNADYKLYDPHILDALEYQEREGQTIGLHKSSYESSIAEEAALISEEHNRFHYLKFSLPAAWHELECSDIKNDYSLGFGVKMGFRNGYGKPFHPYNFKTGKAFNLKVYPLHIMDSSFMYYSKLSEQEIYHSISNFIEANANNCTLSILWHNTSFSNYSFKNIHDIYIKLLTHVKHLELKSHF